MGLKTALQSALTQNLRRETSSERPDRNQQFDPLAVVSFLTFLFRHFPEYLST